MSLGRKLKLSKSFIPCQVDDEDELYPNGIFVFNITKLVAHIKTNAGNFPIEEIDIRSLPTSTSSDLNEETVLTANLANPIVLAEISPGRYNVIDGNHRLARAHREGREKILAYRITMEQHLALLTSVEAYKAFVQYWNSKLDDEYEEKLITLNDAERDRFVESLLCAPQRKTAYKKAKADFNKK